MGREGLKVGSVQSEIECPSCNYENALEDFYYKTDEYWIMCSRCGYYEEHTAKTDIVKSKRIYNAIKKLLKKNKIKEALSIAGLKEPMYVNKKGEEVLDKTVAISRLKDKLTYIKQSNFRHYFATDKDGNVVYETNISNNGIATRYKPKEGATLSCGGIPIKEKANYIKWALANKKVLEFAEITYQDGDEWIIEEILSGKKRIW